MTIMIRVRWLSRWFITDTISTMQQSQQAMLSIVKNVIPLDFFKLFFLFLSKSNLVLCPKTMNEINIFANSFSYFSIYYFQNNVLSGTGKGGVRSCRLAM